MALCLFGLAFTLLPTPPAPASSSPLATQSAALGQTTLAVPQMQLPKVRDRSEIRFVPRRQHSKTHILGQLLLDPARRKHSHTVAIQQQLGHHPQMVRRLTPVLLLVYTLDRTQIQLVHHVGDEIR